jgi:hypothetical protein
VLGAAVQPQTQPHNASPKIYRPRRPAATLLHKTVRENIETYLAVGRQDGEFTGDVPRHVEAAFREYLKCGLFCHGFARTPFCLFIRRRNVAHAAPSDHEHDQVCLLKMKGRKIFRE